MILNSFCQENFHIFGLDEINFYFKKIVGMPLFIGDTVVREIKI